MGDPHRPTAQTVELIDSSIEQPAIGDEVLALGLGGTICREVWKADSPQFFIAWMRYPKIPASVKKILYPEIVF